MTMLPPEPLPEPPCHATEVDDQAMAEQTWALVQARHWRQRANQALLSGDHATAVQCWREVGRRQPDAIDAAFYLGCCLALTHQPQRACLLFESLAESPRTPAALRQRAARLADLLAPEVADLR